MKAAAIGLYAKAREGFDARVAHVEATLESAAAEYGARIVQASSLGVEDMVLTDLIARHRLPIAVATLDTGLLHAETLALMARIEQHYDLRIERHRPNADDVVHFVREHGERAMYRSIELRQSCCELRKLRPLASMLEGRSAWITGLRREQSSQRARVPFRDTDADGRVKLNPLADWSWGDLWHYTEVHDVPYNELHDNFYPSIGCAPCTRAIAVGEDFRSGRWWWEQEGAKECGLHLRPATINEEANA